MRYAHTMILEALIDPASDPFITHDNFCGYNSYTDNTVTVSRSNLWIFRDPS